MTGVSHKDQGAVRKAATDGSNQTQEGLGLFHKFTLLDFEPHSTAGSNGLQPAAGGNIPDSNS
jgi:hypothetical protein